MDGSGLIPPFKKYYPSIEDMDSVQLRFYRTLQRHLDRNSKVSVEGQVSYLFVYTYQLFAEIRKRNYAWLRKRLLELASMYEEEGNYQRYCMDWASDCLLAQRLVDRWLTEHQPPHPLRRDYREADRISVLSHLKRPIPVREWLFLYQQPRINKRCFDNSERFLEKVEEVLHEDEAENGTILGQIQRHLSPKERTDWYLFQGVPLRRLRCVVPRLVLNPPDSVRNKLAVLAREAENKLREELGLHRLKPLKPPRRRSEPIVAFRDGTVVHEKHMRWPWVHYPGFYGIFFAFAQSEDTGPVFCGCSKQAIENYFSTEVESIPTDELGWHRFYVSAKSQFPKAFEAGFQESQPGTIQDFVQNLPYRDGLCHECNQKAPTLRYCHEMYGTVFIQTYGWYVNKHRYDCGFDRNGNILPSKAVTEILEEQVVAAKEYQRTSQRGVTGNARTGDDEILDQYQEGLRRIEHFLENRVRRIFGHKPLGEAWTSETMLYHMVRDLYAPREVLFHHRPEFLKGLELDVFVPHLRVGIEYQGIQHYEPVAHWGGREILQATRARDERKRQLCIENGVRLLAVHYGESLTEEHIKQRIKEVLEAS